MKKDYKIKLDEQTKNSFDWFKKETNLNNDKALKMLIQLGKMYLKQQGE